MEIITQPFNLVIRDININRCPVCNLKLNIKKTIRKNNIKECIKCSWSQCGYCSYSDRPFAIGSSSLENNYPDGCSCKYPSNLKCECEFKEIQIITITCNNCRIPKCNDCKNNIINTDYKPLYLHEYCRITSVGKLECNCGQYNRNSPSDELQNLCSPCNYKLNTGDFNSKFICNHCYIKRQLHKNDFIKQSPDPSDDRNEYILDASNPFKLKWNKTYTTNNCLNCNNDIKCLEVVKYKYKYCSKCNPSTHFIKFKWVENNWSIKLIKILKNGKHKWMSPSNNNNYDKNYVCECDKCKKYIIKINENKKLFFNKLNKVTNDSNLINNIITKLFDSEKSLKVNIKDIIKSYNYDITNNIDNNIETIIKIYKRELLCEYSSDED